MARLFDDAQSQYLRRDGIPPVTAYPFVMNCFFRINDVELATTQCMMWLGDKDAIKHAHSLWYSTDEDKCYVESRIDADRNYAQSAQVIAENTWYQICGLFVSATDRRILINAANKATNSGSVTPVNLDRICIGAFGRGAGIVAFISGEIAEAAIWDLSAWPGATASDKADYFEANVIPGLAAGKRPSVYTTGLPAYWPLVSDDDDHIGEFDLTPYNTPSWATHPTVLCLLTEPVTAADAENGLRILTAEITESAAAADAENGLRILTAEITESANAVDIEDGFIPTIYESAIIEAANAVSAQDSYFVCVEIPPFMQKHLIDPFAGGAWLWLAKVVVPGQVTQRIARNTEDVRYAAENYIKWNLDIGRQTFVGDGSIPRTPLRIAQDPARIFENIVNNSKGCHGGTVKLIRTNENYLEYEVKALEIDYDILIADSDWEWVYLTLGIPNLLTQKIPLFIGSSKTCPWAIPDLFKGPRCQYAGAKTSCTGSLEDCRDVKNNATHWGGEIGLDPNATRV